ncbi:hypothetical protein J4434_03430 [Candidatus Woesearchaeota archaeon]|nr:hypothetical protein [Candidatus Woesearchaeota archaeon]
MSLKEQTIQQIEQNNLKINPNYDQHFLVDEKAISELISAANITKKDIVLEIGSGTGNITKELAKYAQKVICVEVDSQFKQIMQTIPTANVIVIYDHAMDVLRKKAGNFNKIIANLPFSICESLLKHLIFAKYVELCVLIVPKSFAEKALQNPIFTAFLNINKLKDIAKESFYPLPDTTSVIISITHWSNYEEDNEDNKEYKKEAEGKNNEKDRAFLKRKLYMQEEKKLANGLREAIIDLYFMKYKKRLSKKDAKKIIDSFGLDVFLLETLIKDMPLEAYDKATEKVRI